MVDLKGVAAARRRRDDPRVEGSCVWFEDVRFVRPRFELGRFDSDERVRFAGGCWVADEFFRFGGIINGNPLNEIYHT